MEFALKHRNKKKPPPDAFKDTGYKEVVKATQPLFELQSVQIFNHKFMEFRDIKIYGAIILVDDLGNEFCIFNCKRHCAKTIILDHGREETTILEKFELGSPRCLPGMLWLIFQLKGLHGDTEVEIINDWKKLDFTGDVEFLYDQPQRSEFTNVIVTHRILRFATLADVGFLVSEECCGKAHQKARDTVGLKIFGAIELSDKTPYVYVLFAGEFDFDNFTRLPTFAVPAYSTLQIIVRLFVNRELVLEDFVKFEPCNGYGWWHERPIKDDKYLIRVFVKWDDAISRLPEAKIREWYVDKNCRKHNKDWMPTTTIRETGEPYYIKPEFKKGLVDSEWAESDCADDILEVFSISVCAYDQRGPTVSLKGSVDYYDCGSLNSIFNGSVTLTPSDDGLVKLVPDIGGSMRSYCLSVRLTDDQGHEICSESVADNQISVEKWYDMRLCSVLRGQNGFAAVHYTIFADAAKAKLLFKVVSHIAPGTAGYQVHGIINTWYSYYDYSTDYAKKYYRSTLFEKEKSDAVKLAAGDEIPLLKTEVAVPVCGSLMVGGSVNVVDGDQCEILKFEKKFPTPLSGDYYVESDGDKIVRGSHFELSVDVKWLPKYSTIPIQDLRISWRPNRQLI